MNGDTGTAVVPVIFARDLRRIHKTASPKKIPKSEVKATPEKILAKHANGQP
jgi:hypothetical protein